MSIFANDIISSCYDGTIHKFVIIGVLFYQSKTKMRIKLKRVWTPYNCINYIMCNGSIGHLFYYFAILIQYIIADTK